MGSVCSCCTHRDPYAPLINLEHIQGQWVRASMLIPTDDEGNVKSKMYTTFENPQEDRCNVNHVIMHQDGSYNIEHGSMVISSDIRGQIMKFEFNGEVDINHVIDCNPGGFMIIASIDRRYVWIMSRSLGYSRIDYECHKTMIESMGYRGKWIYFQNERFPEVETTSLINEDDQD